MTYRETILLTGFGPFPGMPVNASGELAGRLARAARARYPCCRIVAGVLPTEWEAAPRLLALLLDDTRPALALHFGVSRDAEGFVLETQARNATSAIEDAAGALPERACVLDRGPPLLAARLRKQAVFMSLAEAGLPARLSRDAGSYLCNMVFYHSLRRAAEASQPRLVGFVHIPAHLGATFTVPERTTNRARRASWPFPSRSRPADVATRPRQGLDWNGAVDGGLLIVASGLEALSQGKTLYGKSG